jgi:hypothetical protein
MAANTPSEYCCHYAFIYIRFIHRVLPPAHPQSVSHVGASIYCARTRMAHTYLPIASQSVDPHTCFWPEAIATSQPTRRIAERQPCRGANSLRPHPHGPTHICLLHYRASARTRVFGRRPSPPVSPHACIGRRPSQLGGAAALT